MILGFKKQFVQPIMEGTKIHSIREDKHRRWKAEMKIHFATGVRTKNYNQFKQAVCVSIQEIEIIRKSDYLNETVVKIDSVQLTEKQVQMLAWNDGFENLIDFWTWFSEDFKGVIIHWTDFNY